MGQQQSIGERTDPARDRGDRRRHADRRREVDVADDPPVDQVDPDIDDDRARLEHGPVDQTRPAGGDDDDVGAADMGGQVARPRMADRHGRVLPDQQECGRHADDGGPTDDDGVPSGDLDPRAAQDLDRGVRGRRQEPVVAEAQQAGVEGMDPVDVLGRIDGVDDLAQPDRRRERHLDDDAVDRRVGVDLVERRDHGRLGRLALELHELGRDADLRAAAQDLLEVDRRWGVTTDDHHRQARRATLRRR